MARYLVKRVVWAAVLFVAITLVTFIIFFVVPTEPGGSIRGRTVQPMDLRTAVAIEGPIYEEYAEFLWRVVSHGSLGESWVTGRDVNSVVATAAPVTASLVFGGVVVWLLLGFAVGILSAMRPRSLLDRAATVFVLIGISLHPVWLGLILSYTFGFKLHLTPLGGYCDLINPSTYCGGPVQWAYHLILPWITFAALFAALYVRIIRASVLETMDEDYVRTARAKGASEWRIMSSHVVRNALLPVVTMVGMDLSVALGGVLFVESVFGLPGLGRIAVDSLRRHDLPMITGIVVFVTMAVVLVNLVVDLLHARIDPRIRLAERDFEGTVSRTPRSSESVPDSVGQPA